MLKRKQLVIQFFDFFKTNSKPNKDVEHSVTCKCGWKGKYKSSRGYTNLQAHIVSAHPGHLSSSELRSVKHLKKQFQDFEDITDERNQSISFAERILKKQKLEAVSSSSSYIDLRFLIPTSHICERLFSKAGFSFNQRRMSVLPINAESQMFLYLNSSLWDIAIVKDILSKTQD